MFALLNTVSYFLFWLLVHFNQVLFLAIKVEKKEGEKIDYNKMKVKELKTLLGIVTHFILHIVANNIFLLDQRGVKCVGCSEKSDFVKKCQETEHLDL